MVQPIGAEQLWHAVLDDLQGRVTRANYETWLRAVSITEFDALAAKVVIAAPNTFLMENVQKRFHTQIVRSCGAFSGWKWRSAIPWSRKVTDLLR